jgi:hypothetical protein
MSDSARACSTPTRGLFLVSSANGEISSLCQVNWGDFRKIVRGGLLGIGCGIGMWAGLFRLLTSLKL